MAEIAGACREPGKQENLRWGGHETLWTAGPEARETLGGRTLRRGQEG